MINNPAHLFEFLREGHSIILPEAFIALVFFCQEGDYDDRIQVVFNVFDIDGGGELDRKECSKLMQASIYGLTKLAGLPSPQKARVSEYI